MLKLRALSGVGTNANAILIDSLIVTNIVHRTILEDLIAKKVTHVCDPEWTKYMRFYWKNGGVSVKIESFELDYGYEYIGQKRNLVMTHLSHQAYRHIAQNTIAGQGICFAGPAGTGKTETVKDMARYCGQLCLCTSISD